MKCRKGVIFLRWFLSSLSEELEMDVLSQKKKLFELRRSGNDGDSSVCRMVVMKSVWVFSFF